MGLKIDAKVPETFSKIKGELAEDRAYCAIIAVAAITGEPVMKVREMMEANGRKRGHGTRREVTRKTLEQLGYKIKEWSFRERWDLIATYPKPHNELENITTHHPRRFPSAWACQPNMLMFSAKHVAAYVDGVVCDWTVKHSKWVVEIWTLEKA